MRRPHLVLGIVISLAMALPAGADLANPGFESGLGGWSIASGAVSPSSDAQGGFALFSEGGGVGAPAASSLYQDFTISSLDASISFEYALSTMGTHNPTVLPDAFTARLIDPLTLQPLLNTAGRSDFFYHDARGMADSVAFDTGLVSLDPGASRADWSTVELDLSGLAPGTAARLQFDLFGTGILDGQITLAGVDNLAVEAGVIPAPSALILGLIGLGTIRALRRKLA